MESDLHLVHFRFLQRGSGAKNSKLPENIWPTPGYSPGFSPAFSGRMRKILGFLRTVKHPPSLEQAVPGVSTGRSRIKVRRSINVFGCIALGAELQLTRGEFVCCPGIETHAGLDDPKSDHGQHHLFEEADTTFADGGLPESLSPVASSVTCASLVPPHGIANVTLVTDGPRD